MRNVWIIPLKKVLVKATAVVQGFESRLQALRGVDSVCIEAFVANAPNPHKATPTSPLLVKKV